MTAPGTRLAVWSGPRNISTALMRSWETRADCKVVDEPLYAYFLAATGIDHPGREVVIASGETDPEKVISDLTGPVEGVFYQKHMAHHLLPNLRRDWIPSLSNILLIRNPSEVVASYVRTRPALCPDDIGLRQQSELFDELGELGETVPVVDAADFLRSPESYLRYMCSHVRVPFTETMLSWPPGRRATDGVWGEYWYDAVVRSTGFEPYDARPVDPDGEAFEVAEACLPYYERLWSRRVVL